MKVKTAFTIMLLMLVAFVPAVSAQGNDYSVTAEEAFKHANAHTIKLIATDTQNFGNWKGAFIDSKPLELYDINGQKLYYQFPVYKNNNIIGKVAIGADKKLGQSVQLIEFNPKSFDATGVMNKSIEIAEKEYPTGEIKSTKMVVYNYPAIGAMTIVKDKTTKDEHRIFVDAYTLDVIPDKPANETEHGVWSIYEQRLNNGVENNLKCWQASDNFTKSIEQEATGMGINISAPITEEEMGKIIGNATIPLTGTSKYLNVPLYGQENNYYCAPTTAQMISAYYSVSYTQLYIYGKMNGVAPNGVSYANQLVYYKLSLNSGGLGKTNSITKNQPFTFTDAVNEINNNRPFANGVSDGVTSHVRACNGYYYDSGTQYLAIKDPLPVGSGNYYLSLTV
jgi:hypothetical protein